MDFGPGGRRRAFCLNRDLDEISLPVRDCFAIWNAMALDDGRSWLELLYDGLGAFGARQKLLSPF